MHLWPWGDASMLGGTTHLTAQGFMPNGFSSVITALLGVMFAYMGAEIVTVAAAETKDPAKEIRKAANSIVWRIILFYVGSMLITVCLIPHNNPLLKDPTWGRIVWHLLHSVFRKRAILLILSCSPRYVAALTPHFIPVHAWSIPSRNVEMPQRVLV